MRTGLRVKPTICDYDESKNRWYVEIGKMMWKIYISSVHEELELYFSYKLFGNKIPYELIKLVVDKNKPEKIDFSTLMQKCENMMI